MLRMLSTTECGDWTKETIQTELSKPLEAFHNVHSLKAIENKFNQRKKHKRLKLIKDVREDLSDIVVYPWFYACNKKRYPVWEGKHDPRVV